MSGGGMGFIFDPTIKEEASIILGDIMLKSKREMECSLPFAMDPVVFNYTVNERGTFAELKSRIMEKDESEQSTELASTVKKQSLSNDLLNRLLKEHGFDAVLQAHIRTELQNGTIGLAKNRLPPTSEITDVTIDDVVSLNGNPISPDTRSRGLEALSSGRVGVITLAAGVGSRWTQGAGVVKALNPYCSIRGKRRNFIDVHLAKNRKVSADSGVTIPHVFTTSWMTHEPINGYIASLNNDSIYVSKGAFIGLRMIPMIRDLNFLFQEQRHQKLDEQAQKVQNSLHTALLGWVDSHGEGADYTLNAPKQCLCPVGHFYEVPNLLLNGTLARMLRDRPQLQTLMLHNIDTIGVDVDANILGTFLESGSTLAYEVVPRCIEDMGKCNYLQSLGWSSLLIIALRS